MGIVMGIFQVSSPLIVIIYLLSSMCGCMSIIFSSLTAVHLIITTSLAAVSRHRQHQMMDNVDTKCRKKTNVQSTAANDPSVLIITEKAPRAPFSIVS